MKQNYNHLTEVERYPLFTMRKPHQSFQVIAKGMGCPPSILSLEVKRNTGQKGYRYQQAQHLTKPRHQEKNKVRKWMTSVRSYIQEKLQTRWSPEQICGRVCGDQGFAGNPETIDRFVLTVRQQGGTSTGHLRHQAKPYRKRYGCKEHRGHIPGRIDMAEQPVIDDARTRVGDWEADLVIGRGHKGALVTLAEWRSRRYLALLIIGKLCDLPIQAITTLLAALKDWTQSITYDNSREFKEHAPIAKALDCRGFFACPYHLWERGLNENSKGLLRQYFPKKSPLDRVLKEKVAAAVRALKYGPRKCLGVSNAVGGIHKFDGLKSTILNQWCPYRLNSRYIFEICASLLNLKVAV